MEKTATTSAAAAHVAIQDKLVDYLINHGPALISAIVIVLMGLLAARWIGRLTEKWFEHRSMEPPVRMLLVRLVKLFVLVCALVVALETAGMNLTAVIAGISVAGVGVGLAMQGVLGNLVAGLTIIFTKPFRVNEYIALLGVEGQVSKIELFSTTLTHPDRSRVVIPNRKIVGEIMHNYGTIRQLDLSVGVAYGTNLGDTLLLIREILKANSRILREPEPVVGVTTLADCSINIAIKPWTSVADFAPASAEINQAIVTQFRERKIDIPFPQREIRLLNSTEISRPTLMPGLG